MSDDEDQSSVEDDFSASEDEWKPGKTRRQASDEESDDDDSDFADDIHSSKRRDLKSSLSTSVKADNAAKQTKKRKSSATSLRTKLFNKYKPPPKTVRNQSATSKEVKETRHSSAASTSRLAKKSSRAAKTTNSTESDSSGDDYLVNPDEIDLQSSFFDVKPSTSGTAVANVGGPPQFDCNAGMQLSDSDEDNFDDDDDEDETESIKQPAKATTVPVDLGYLQDFANNLDKAKLEYKKQKERSHMAPVDTKVDVSSLLAMGEGCGTATTSTSLAKKTKNLRRQSKKHQPSQAPADTDSDWEEVEANDDYSAQLPDALTNGIQVNIDLPQGHRKDKKALDVEATLKRRLNRIIKENQVYLHKVSLLCHIHHGLYINKVANNIKLMPLALKLLPSKNAYPSGQTEIKYFQSMVTWYKAAVKIHDERMYPRLKVDPVVSLAVQMKHRHAVCRRDFILMFVILLRAMGMQCRLVVNMVPMPLKPQQSALCSLKMKPTDSDDKKREIKTEKISAKKEPIRSPLSRKEREELKLKVETLEKEILKKKRVIVKPKPSFEEELQVKAPTIPEKKVKVSSKSEKKIEKDDLLEVKVTAKNKDKSETKKLSFEEQLDSNVSPKHGKIKRKITEKNTKEQLEVKVPSKLAKKADKSKPKATAANTEEERFQNPTKNNNKPQRTAVAKKTYSKEQLEVKDLSKLQVKKDDLKRKSLDNSNEPDKKTKVKLTTSKSPYFPDSSQKQEQTQLLASLDSHSKSFDKQLPSISINSQAAKSSTSQKMQTRTEIMANSKKKVTPDIVIVAGSSNLGVQNITNKKQIVTRSRSKSPKAYISPAFLQNKTASSCEAPTQVKRTRSKSPNPSGLASAKSYISTDFLKLPKTKRNATATVTDVNPLEKPSPRKLRSKTKLTVPQLDGADDLPRSRRKQAIKKSQPHNSDDDFHPSVPKKSKALERVKTIDRQVLSPDTGDEGQASSRSRKNTINIWVEVYSELEGQWVCLDLFKGKVHCVDSIRKTVTPSTLAYVFAFNNDATVKDVTPRYCAQWAAVVRKSRVEQSWLDEAIRQYVTTSRTQQDLTEDMDLRRIHLDKPMPTSISEYKDHPLYALERHLLKFQAIYPANALTLGFVRGEPVYARECVHTLHSREIWLKSARTVKPGEKPYKIVKARPKWDKFTSTVIKDQPLDIFGYWQTQDYEPPTAENGIVPRNAYGNVELFKECMLPKKTVHLHLPGLNRVCKKLGIDCVPAVIGFDFHQGSCHPLYDGFVVCEEFAEKAADAWDKDQQEAERKEQEKYEARVYGNWKKLIKGLLIRERLKIKYNF